MSDRGAPDGQPMVFAHGFGCDQAMWRHVAPVLEDRYRVILFDHAGSRSNPAEYDEDRHATLDGYADDVLTVVDELDLFDVIFVGHSVSAMIGVLAVKREPQRFASLVMVGPSARYLNDDGYVGASQRREYEQELVRERERARLSEARAHEVAQRLQAMLIPPAPPTIEGLDVGAAYRPAGDGGMIGGDFYDVFEFESQDWLVVIGDVSGKGIEAAAVAALARHTIRAAAVQSKQLDVVMRHVNRVLLTDRTDRFCTIVLVRFTRTGDRWSAAVCAGGHPLPLLLRPGHEPVQVRKHGGMVGAFSGVSFHHVPVPIEPGDTLLLYTDGVTEARSLGEFYGEQGLIESARRPLTTAAELAMSIVDDVVAYQEGYAADDIAAVAVHIPEAG